MSVSRHRQYKPVRHFPLVKNVILNFKKMFCSCLRLTVVAFKETPSFNPRRRKSGVLLSMRHSMSSNAMMLDASSIASSSTTGSSSTPSPTLVYSSLTSRSMNRRQQQQPSPSPSSTDRWLESNPMCMSTVSVRSDTGSSSSCTAESEDNGSSLTGNDRPAGPYCFDYLSLHDSNLSLSFFL